MISKTNIHVVLDDINSLVDNLSSEEVDAIINCAALVKYYGDAEAFHKANVMSVKNLAEFAIKRNIIFNHISTLSVLGEDSSSPIDEHSFYINQDEVFNNQYIESKFLGEFEILLFIPEKVC